MVLDRLARRLRTPAWAHIVRRTAVIELVANRWRWDWQLRPPIDLWRAKDTVCRRPLGAPGGGVAMTTSVRAMWWVLASAGEACHDRARLPRLLLLPENGSRIRLSAFAIRFARFFTKTSY